MSDDRALIEAAFADRAKLKDAAHAAAVERTIARLDKGEIRVASPPESEGGEWTTHAWIKQAILLYFGLRGMETMTVGPFEFHDKIPLKKDLAGQGVRVVPPGVVRYGAFCEPTVIVMPGYVNIGARVGAIRPLAAIHSPSDQEKRAVSQTIEALDGRSSARKPTGSALSGSSAPSAPRISYL